MEKLLIDTEAFQLSQGDFIIRLLVAIGIGALIGLEREHAALNEKTRNFAGIRTFIFVVLMGFLGGLMFYALSPWVYVCVFIIVAILTGISYWITASGGEIGATTEFSALIAFFLGTLTILGFIAISLAITVIVVLLLSAKFKLHAIIGKLTENELYDFIRFVVIVLLIFPFLPDEQMGQYNVINPKEIGWVIILTSGLGFIGYMLMKFMKAKSGILLTGIIGGLVSSTAVTWVFARKSKENPTHSHSCAIAILAASSIMIIRVLVWVFVFNRPLFEQVYLAFGIVFLTAIGITLFIYYRQARTKIESTIRQGKPLDLKGAMVFGILYTAILLVVSYANETMGERGLLISSAVSGMSDIDAITITVSKLALSGLNYSIAANAILIATISNTLVKLGIAIWAGSRELRKDLYIGYGAIFISAVLVILFI